jgi:exopolysaccharide biosynthesis polyprenyl glycosylphosphotransferase
MSSKIECYSIPKISDIYIQNAEVLQLNDKLLLKYPKMEIQDEKKAAKRLLDIVGALVMLVCASPVMLVIAILIKLEDGGKIFYLQDRVTQDGRPFLMCKFRSMHPNAEKDGARLAQKNDDRVTRVGRVIRNLHFDELPQLINVLKGEMSLVGPRPERQEFIDEYSKKIPEFPERLKVKGGLTGYAQVYGRYNSEPEDKIKYDLYYIYNYSLWLDIKILILTIRILFQKENTEGVDEDQISAMKNKP